MVCVCVCVCSMHSHLEFVCVHMCVCVPAQCIHKSVQICVCACVCVRAHVCAHLCVYMWRLEEDIVSSSSLVHFIALSLGLLLNQRPAILARLSGLSLPILRLQACAATQYVNMGAGIQSQAQETLFLIESPPQSIV